MEAEALTLSVGTACVVVMAIIGGLWHYFRNISNCDKLKAELEGKINLLQEKQLALSAHRISTKKEMAEMRAEVEKRLVDVRAENKESSDKLIEEMNFIKGQLQKVSTDLAKITGYLEATAAKNK